MADVITTYDPSSASTGTFQATLPGGGNQGGKISLWNESNIGQYIQWNDGGRTHKDYLPPWTAILINICQTSNLTFTWTQALILSSTNPPASQVIVVQYMPYENISNAFPIPITRQANIGNSLAINGTVNAAIQGTVNASIAGTVNASIQGTANVAVASGVINVGNVVSGAGSPQGYSTFFSYTSPANPPALNLFNASTNTITAYFYFWRLITSGGSGAGGTLYYFQGADINLANGLTPVPHTLGGPASQLHATFTVNQNIIQAIVAIDSITQLAAFTQYEYIPFPDQIAVPPGYNILMVATGPAGTVGAMSTRCSER